MEYSTPALVIDLDIFEANLAAAQKLVSGTGKLLRPHFKTHRSPGLALRQLGTAAKGMTCATVGEVETLVNAGVGDLLLANEVVSPEKIETLARLASRADLMVAVDALGPLQALTRACQRVGTEIGVLVDVNVGLDRCGVRSLEAAQELAQVAASTIGVRFKGLMGYEGRLRASDPNRLKKIRQAFGRLAETRECLQAKGLEVEVISGAGTSTLREALADETITEIQAGTYCMMEPDILDLDLPFSCGVWVVGTVISRSPGRVVLDVGRRNVGSDHGLPISENPRASTFSLNDEHIILDWEGPAPDLGERVRLRPTQNRTTFNLYDFVWLVRGEQVVGVEPVTARGRS